MPVADHPALLQGHALPTAKHLEGVGEGVVPSDASQEQVLGPLKALAPEPPALERGHGSLGLRDLGVDVLPVGPGLLHPQGKAEQARMDLGSLAGLAAAVSPRCRCCVAGGGLAHEATS